MADTITFNPGTPAPAPAVAPVNKLLLVALVGLAVWVAWKADRM